MSADLDFLVETYDSREGDELDYGGSILSEIVKSYGFARDPVSQTWSWSTENIAEAFGESPVWTTVDWITLGFPVVKWGTAAGSVLRGSTPAGRAYEARRLGFREAVGIRGRLAPRSPIMRKLSHPQPYDEKTMEIVRDFPGAGGMIDTADLDWVVRGLKREYDAELALINKMTEDTIQAYRRADMTPDEEKAVDMLLRLDPEKRPQITQGMWDYFKAHRLRPDSQKALEAEMAFRERMQIEYAENYLLDRETLAKLGRGSEYRRTAYAEFQQQQAAKGFRRMRGRRRYAKEGEKAFLRKGPDREDLTRVTDPIFLAHKHWESATVLARQKYVLSVARSVAAKSDDELIEHFGTLEAAAAAGWDETTKVKNIAPGKKEFTPSRRLQTLRDRHKQLAKRSKEVDRLHRKIGERATRQVQRVEDLGNSAFERRLREEFLASQGRRRPTALGRARQRLDDLRSERARTVQFSDWLAGRLAKERDRVTRQLEKVGRQIDDRLEVEQLDTFLQRMPRELLEMRMDPAIAEDVKGIFKSMGGNDNLLSRLYYSLQSRFKVWHTSYNPATISRNFLGNVMFWSFAAGARGGIKLYPAKGVKALRGRGYKREMEEFVSRGGTGTSMDAEVQELIRKVIGDEPGDTFEFAALRKLLKDDRVVEYLKRGDMAARKFYGAIDDAWKMDAYITLRNRFYRNGQGMYSMEEAANKAFLEVQRYFPNYAEGSDLLKALRQHIPFVSFTIEGMRVWKNAMAFRPHMAFYWNHLTEVSSQAAAAVAGIAPDEMQAARESLPWYTHDKKMLLFPFKDGDGKPHFLDLSYIIPIADMGAEAATAENSFMGIPTPIAMFNPGTNPWASIIGGGITGWDPFTGRPIEPRFTEQQLGQAVPEGAARKFFGMAEHTLRTILPPLVPPGYAATNLLELIRGTRSGYTGKELEQDARRTVLANIAGLRTYEPTVEAQLVNIRREQRLSGEKTSNAWDRWESYIANGDIQGAERERARIIALKGADFFNRNFTKHLPGSYGNVGSRDIREVIRRSHRFGTAPGEMVGVYRRYLELQSR